MRWSVWPKETKSTCAVDITQTADSSDGSLGARTVFYSKGKRFGHQEVIGLQENQQVKLTLQIKGPPHTPELAFNLYSAENSNTRVELRFINKLPRPFNAIWNFAGLSKWIRKMHVKDLEGLKAFSEPPHLDSDGNVVGRPPTGTNPYVQSSTAV